MDHEVPEAMIPCTYWSNRNTIQKRLNMSHSTYAKNTNGFCQSNKCWWTAR